MTADRIVLWRHGRTRSNVDGRFQGQLDVPLDEVGLEQAEDAADLLAGLLAADARAGRVCLVASDLRRTMQTATPLSERLGLPIVQDPGLRERGAGSWEGLLRDEIEATYPEDFARWRAGEDFPLGGGETLSGASERAEDALRRHAAAMDGGTLVAISHGAAGRGGLLRLVGLPSQAYVSFEGLSNCHWADARRRAGAWVLAGYNIGPLRLPPSCEG